MQLPKVWGGWNESGRAGGPAPLQHLDVRDQQLTCILDPCGHCDYTGGTAARAQSRGLWSWSNPATGVAGFPAFKKQFVRNSKKEFRLRGAVKRRKNGLRPGCHKVGDIGHLREQWAAPHFPASAGMRTQHKRSMLVCHHGFGTWSGPALVENLNSHRIDSVGTSSVVRAA
jgi:hypothetical protein